MRVPYARSARAAQPRLKREVEIRILRGGTPDELTHLFFDELKELGRIDHPSFLPVLNDMSLEGRPCYAVPLREHEDLGALVGREDFTLEDRGLAVRSLANAMAVLHAQEITMGPLPPELVAWDPEAGRVYLRHHKTVPEHWKRGLLQHTPLAAEEAAEQMDPRGDVFYWGVLSFWLLSRGQHPYGLGPGELRPLRGLVPELAASVASAVESACAWDPALRPASGLEICSVLQLDATNVVAGQERPAEKLDIHAVASRVLEKVEDLRTSGRIQAFRPPPQRRAEADADADAMLRSDDSLVGVPADLAKLAAEARRRGLQPDEGPAPPDQIPRLGLVGLLLLGLTLGYYLSTGELPRIPWELLPSASSSPPAQGATPRPDPGPGPARVEDVLSHTGPVGGDEFERLWGKLRSLEEAGALPGGGDGKGRLAKLFMEFKANPTAACAHLEQWIEELRKLPR